MCDINKKEIQRIQRHVAEAVKAVKSETRTNMVALMNVARSTRTESNAELCKAIEVLKARDVELDKQIASLLSSVNGLNAAISKLK